MFNIHQLTFSLLEGYIFRLYNLYILQKITYYLLRDLLVIILIVKNVH
jgi:hypothetical protein